MDRIPVLLSWKSNSRSAAIHMTYAIYINTWRRRARAHRFDCAISRNRFSDPDYGYWLDADTHEGALEAVRELPLDDVSDCDLWLLPE